MHLTAHTDYALRTLVYLMCHRPRIVSTREIAAAYDISLNHLTKVAKSLTKAGWLVSTRGGQGGLALAPHAPDATVGEIVRHTERLSIAVCFANAKACPLTTSCQLKSVLHRARAAFLDVLDSATIADISSNPLELNFLLQSTSPAPRVSRKTGIADAAAATGTAPRRGAASPRSPGKRRPR